MISGGDGLVFAGDVLVAGGWRMPTFNVASSSATLYPTSSATAHTPGSWVEAIASNPTATQWLTVVLVLGASQRHFDNSTIMEVGVGASGAETVVGQFPVGYVSNDLSHASLSIPFPVAAGVRVAVRVRAAVGSTVIRSLVSLGTSPTPASLPVAYGVNLATSRGATITAPGSLGVQGTWLEMVSSTPADWAGVHARPQLNGSTNAGGNFTLQIGVGATSGSAVVVGEFSGVVYNGVIVAVYSTSMVWHVIPAGSKVWARYSRSDARVVLDLIMHGVPL